MCSSFSKLFISILRYKAKTTSMNDIKESVLILSFPAFRKSKDSGADAIDRL